MRALSYKSKGLLPGVLLDRKSGKFEIFGKSCPEDAGKFYDPVYRWFDDYIANPLKKTVLDLKLSYFNTVSAKSLLSIMTKMEKLSHTGHDVKIRWFYREDDEDSEEAGEEFENIIDVKFEMISVKNKTTGFKNEGYFDSLFDGFL